jgi:hypothetical protein
MRRTNAENRFMCNLYNRAAGDGRSIVYVRFIDTRTGEIVATRSTGKATEKAPPRIAELLAELGLKTLFKAKETVRATDLDDERLAGMTVSAFADCFWGESS